MNLTTDNTFEELENAIYSVPFPPAPVRPNILAYGKSPTPADYRAHAEAMEAYERNVAAQEDAHRIYFHQRSVLEGIWKKKLRDEHSHLNDDTFNACYSKAYDDGHSCGYSAVRDCMDDITKLAEKIINANK